MTTTTRTLTDREMTAVRRAYSELLDATVQHHDECRCPLCRTRTEMTRLHDRSVVVAVKSATP